MDRGEGLAQRLGPHPTLVVGGDPTDVVALAAQTQHLERSVDRDVRSAMSHDRDRRGALQPQSLHVPAGLREDPVASRRKGREVGHRGAGHEADARAARQIQQLDEPGTGDLLRDRGRRRHDVQASVLIPGAGQPVRAEGRRQAAPDDKAEVAWAGAADQARFGGGRKPLHHLDRIGRTTWERAAEGRSERDQVDRSAHRSGGQRIQVVVRQGGGPRQNSRVVGNVGHRRSLSRWSCLGRCTRSSA